jgi:hypothetical protein
MQVDTVRVPTCIVVVAEPAGEPMAVGSIVKVGMSGVQTAGRSQTCTNVTSDHVCACHARPRSSHAGTSEMEGSNAASPDVRAAEVITTQVTTTELSAADVAATHVHSATAAEMDAAAATTKMGSAAATEMGSAAATTEMSATATTMAAAAATAAPSECIRCN